jgi:hypothetical protein
MGHLIWSPKQGYNPDMNLVISQLPSVKPLLLQREESRAQRAMPGRCGAWKNERVMGDQAGFFHRGGAERCPYLQ